MKLAERIKTNARYQKIVNYLESGLITLLDAVNEIDAMWRRGEMFLAEAETAIRMLSKVKTPR